eukprot:TRINITY_DN11098_c0_g2_i1.p1 TRINITY_DN11098_c0_g2~~TRINITY_DN11098_c0_g2_i1.p1  ORF type:complete len:708 (+),score=84.77 TRINITY_DN11098_c0_g2_i1:175-2298(+)
MPEDQGEERRAQDGTLDVEVLDLLEHEVVVVVLVIIAWLCVSFVTDVKKLCGAMKSYMRSFYESSCDDGDALGEWCWTYIQQFNTVVCVALLIQSTFMVYSCIRLGSARSSTNAEDYAILLLIYMVISFQFSRNSMRRCFGTWRGSHIYYVVFMVLCTSWVACSSSDNRVARDLAVMPFRIALCMLPLKRRCTILGNLLFDGVASGLFYVRARSGACGDIYVKLPHVHLVLSVVLMHVPIIIKQLLLSERKATKKASVMYAAAMRLLDLLCDAVIELGEDLRFVSDVPKLNAMLFIGSGNTLKGAKFPDLATSSSKDQCCESLEKMGADGVDVGAFNVTLDDAIGNSLHLEAFYIHIADTESDTCYLVGLREMSQMDGRTASFPLAPLNGPRLTGPQSAFSWLDDASDLDSASTMSSTMSSTLEDNLAVPRKLLTRQHAKVALIENLLRRIHWEKQVDVQRGCCKWHDALQAFNTALLGWKRELCYASFCYHTAWQCQGCGILGDCVPLGSCQVCRAPCAGGSAGILHSYSPPELAAAAGMAVHGKNLQDIASHAVDEQELSTASTGDRTQAGDTVAAAADESCGCRLVVPEKTVTSLPASQVLIKNVLRSANFRVENGTFGDCCHKHQAVDHFLMLVAGMLEQPCNTAFSQYSSWQCGLCGVLSDSVPGDTTCLTCSHLHPCDTGARQNSIAFSTAREGYPRQVDL